MSRVCYSTDNVVMGKIRAERPLHPSREMKVNRELNLLRIKGDMKSFKVYLAKESK